MPRLGSEHHNWNGGFSNSRQLSDHLCECGCKQFTYRRKSSRKAKGVVAGEAYKYLQGHMTRINPIINGPQRGENNHNWKGGKHIHNNGYISVNPDPGHERFGNGSILEHIYIAEKVLGRRLKKGEIIHHVDENPQNNLYENLVICPSQSYHFLLHRRREALFATGDVHSRKCGFCGMYDKPENLYIHPKGSPAHHRVCARLYSNGQSFCNRPKGRPKKNR